MLTPCPQIRLSKSDSAHWNLGPVSDERSDRTARPPPQAPPQVRAPFYFFEKRGKNGFWVLTLNFTGHFCKCCCSKEQWDGGQAYMARREVLRDGLLDFYFSSGWRVASDGNKMTAGEWDSDSLSLPPTSKWGRQKGCLMRPDTHVQPQRSAIHP